MIKNVNDVAAPRILDELCVRPVWVWVEKANLYSLRLGRIEIAQVTKGSTCWFYYLRFTADDEQVMYATTTLEEALETAEYHLNLVLRVS